MGENGPKWVQNGRQVLRIDPRACRGHCLASGTGPAAQVDPKSAQVGPESAQDTCGMTAVIPQVWDDSPVRPDLSSHLKQRYVAYQSTCGLRSPLPSTAAIAETIGQQMAGFESQPQSLTLSLAVLGHTF